MGRIKSLLVKRTAKKLLESKPLLFNTEFEHNKRVLGNNTMPSKSIRNKIAGYIAHLQKMKKQAVTKPEPQVST